MHLCFLIYQESHLVLIHYLLERFASAQALQRYDGTSARGDMMHDHLEACARRDDQAADSLPMPAATIVTQIKENSAPPPRVEGSLAARPGEA